MAAGQILLKDVATFPIYAVFFEPLWPRDVVLNLSETANSKILLVGATMDARIYHGMWRIVGNVRPDLSHIPMPFFKVMINGRDIIEDFFGRMVRVATAQDIRYYHNRFSSSPMIFEDAVKAYHRLGSVPENMTRLTLEDSIAKSRPSPILGMI